MAGTMYDDYHKPSISYIHKSERSEKIDGEMVKIIELTPIMRTELLSLDYHYRVDFDRMLKYKLYS